MTDVGVTWGHRSHQTWKVQTHPTGSDHSLCYVYTDSRKDSWLHVYTAPLHAATHVHARAHRGHRWRQNESSFLPHAHAQGVKQSVCPSVVCTKIADVGIRANCKYNQTVKWGKNWLDFASNLRHATQILSFVLTTPILLLAMCFCSCTQPTDIVLSVHNNIMRTTTTRLLAYAKVKWSKSSPDLLVWISGERERKRSLKAREQQQAELERIKPLRKGTG